MQQNEPKCTENHSSAHFQKRTLILSQKWCGRAPPHFRNLERAPTWKSSSPKNGEGGPRKHCSYILSLAPSLHDHEIFPHHYSSCSISRKIIVCTSCLAIRVSATSSTCSLLSFDDCLASYTLAHLYMQCASRLCTCFLLAWPRHPRPQLFLAAQSPETYCIQKL